MHPQQFLEVNYNLIKIARENVMFKNNYCPGGGGKGRGCGKGQGKGKGGSGKGGRGKGKGKGKGSQD